MNQIEFYQSRSIKHNAPIAGLSRSNKNVSNFTFAVYIYFLIDFFLHLSARFPLYGVLRPTLVLVILITCLLLTQRELLKKRSEDPVSKSLIALVVYVVFSIPFVDWPGSAINNMPEFVKAIVFFFFTALIVDSEKRLKIFLFVFIACQTIRVLEPLFLNLTTGYWGSSTYLGGGEFASRLSGAPSDIINPNELGFVIVTTMPFIYYFLWLGSNKSKLIFIFLFPLILYALILTMSRGAMVALLIICWMIFKDSKKKGILLIVGFLGVSFTWTMMSPLQKDRYLSLIDSDVQGSTTAEGRWIGMANEFELGFSQPLTGHGLGTTPEAKHHFFGKRQAAHNLYAELIIEIGLIGTFFFLKFIFCIYKLFIRSKKLVDGNHGSDNFYNNLNKTLTAIFWMYAVYSINYWGLSVYYWYFLGGIAVAYSRLICNKCTPLNI